VLQLIFNSASFVIKLSIHLFTPSRCIYSRFVLCIILAGAS